MKARVLSLTLTLSLLAACAGQEDAGPTANTGNVAQTAHSESEGGIGGTGIFGTVTAFGSIVVNGQTIAFDEADVRSQATIAGQDLPLAVGSAVVVEAHSDEEAWVADRVSLFLPLVGPVSTVDGATVVTADVEASNGVIQVIDRVLLPVDAPEADDAGGAGVAMSAADSIDFDDAVIANGMSVSDRVYDDACMDYYYSCVLYRF